MYFDNIYRLRQWVKSHEICYIGGGSQGNCYKIGNKVYKIFLQYIEDDDEEMIEYHNEDILRYSDIVNNTYIFPNDTIMVGESVVGYVTDYVDAKSLYKINSLNISLDKFGKSLERVPIDIKTISDNGVLSFDVTYNIMYGKTGFSVIDTLEYSKTDIDSLKLYRKNMGNFNQGIRLFLLDSYFETFVSNHKGLYDMCYDPEIDFSIFLKELRKKLSEVEGYEISRLRDAKKSIVRIKRMVPNYIRELH